MISFIDTDLYKLTMGQVVFFKFPDVQVKYKFYDRGVQSFPSGFAEKLKEKISNYVKIRKSEIEYLKTLGYFKPLYLEWLSGYEWNQDEVKINQIGGYLDIEIVGPWRRTIYWEVPLMASISELYFDYYPAKKKQISTARNKILDKADYLEKHNVRWSDFGTRRRYNFTHHNYLLNRLVNKGYSCFLGTSNLYFAKKFGFPPIGTMAHEGPMVMQANNILDHSNSVWLDNWISVYGNKLDTMLPDTLTTDYFIKTCDEKYFKHFSGIRQDSGDPDEFIEKIVEHLIKLKINTCKTIVCSDSLDPIKLRDIVDRWKGVIKVVGGIGTNLTNDIEGVKPLNIVIKVVGANFFGTNDFHNVVKLSDNLDKATGETNHLNSIINYVNLHKVFF